MADIRIIPSTGLVNVTGSINFTSGGSTMLFMTGSTLNVGIGTTAPVRPLHLRGSGTRMYIKAETTTNNIGNEAGFDIKTPTANYIIGSWGNRSEERRVGKECPM